MDQSTGQIKTRLPLTGRGRTAPYTLIIGATDGEGLIGDATLTLYIGDVSANDGVPRFITPADGQTIFVSEVSNNLFFLLLIYWRRHTFIFNISIFNRDPVVL